MLLAVAPTPLTAHPPTHPSAPTENGSWPAPNQLPPLCNHPHQHVNWCAKGSRCTIDQAKGGRQWQPGASPTPPPPHDLKWQLARTPIPHLKPAAPTSPPSPLARGGVVCQRGTIKTDLHNECGAVAMPCSPHPRTHPLTKLIAGQAPYPCCPDHLPPLPSPLARRAVVCQRASSKSAPPRGMPMAANCQPQIHPPTHPPTRTRMAVGLPTPSVHAPPAAPTCPHTH